MLTPKEKYDHALRLRNAISTKKDCEGIIQEETAILAQYVADSKDKEFRWKSGLSLTYVSGSPAKSTVDAKRFMELAKDHMTAADYEACISQATKIGSPRKPSFR